MFKLKDYISKLFSEYTPERISDLEEKLNDPQSDRLRLSELGNDYLLNKKYAGKSFWIMASESIKDGCHVYLWPHSNRKADLLFEYLAKTYPGIMKIGITMRDPTQIDVFQETADYNFDVINLSP